MGRRGAQPSQEQLVYVVSGAIELTIAGVAHALSAGDSILVAAALSTRHAPTGPPRSLTFYALPRRLRGKLAAAFDDAGECAVLKKCHRSVFD